MSGKLRLYIEEMHDTAERYLDSLKNGGDSEDSYKLIEPFLENDLLGVTKKTLDRNYNFFCRKGIFLAGLEKGVVARKMNEYLELGMMLADMQAIIEYGVRKSSEDLQ